MRRIATFAAAVGTALLLASPAPAEELLPYAGKFESVAQTVQEKCMACHTHGLSLPFYAKVPGIREVIEKDYRDGVRAMDLNTELVERRKSPVGEVTLAKMEWVVLNDTMPPAKFAMVHWGSRLSAKDRQAILDWVAATRKAHYATDAAPKFANEPIQPLPLKLDVDTRKAAFGNRLYNDKRLSTDSTLSCADCHFYDRGGTDYRRFSLGVRGQSGDVNPPTTFNAAFNVSQFWDGRAASLQEQAGGPPLNPVEMGSKDWKEIIGRLAEDRNLTVEAEAIYPGGWSAEAITNAIAEYEKLLITPNSRFDRWLRGDERALNKREIQGYERFKAYRCSSCHVGRSVGGQSYEYMDLKKDYFADRGGKALGSDAGRFNVTKDPRDLHRFKVPNLRNIELTAPYLHDGTVDTLDDAVRIMGTYCAGIEVTKDDRESIVAFLRTLTGEHKMLSGKAAPH